MGISVGRGTILAIGGAIVGLLVARVVPPKSFPGRFQIAVGADGAANRVDI
jgi:hypothetical protein